MTELNQMIITGVIEATIKVIADHYAITGQMPTDTQVKSQLQDEIRSGRGEIAMWFREHNLPMPE